MIYALEQELLGLVAKVPAFASGGFSVFSLDDLEAKGGPPANYPIVGVGFNGALPVEGNAVSPANKYSSAISLVEATFLVVVGIQYGYTVADDAKPKAFDLLDSVRREVSGYQGVNTRPWRFGGERPEPDASGDGVVFYSQVWHTAFMASGTFNNP